MKELGQILFGIIGAIVALVLVIALIAAGATWYIQSNWGVAAVEQTWRTASMFGLALFAVVLIVIGAWIAQRGNTEGAQTANDAAANTTAVYSEMFKALATTQRAIATTNAADAQYAKAHAAQADADAKIRVLDYKAQLEAEQRAMLPTPEPVRRAPWELTDSQHVPQESRFQRMH